MTVARQGRRSVKVGDWSRDGLVGEWTFESSDGTDTSPPAANNLILSNTAIVAGINGLALDTQTVGYGSKTGVTADLKTSTGTLQRYFKRTDLTKNSYISFSTAGGATDEIQLLVRGNGGTFPNGVQLSVIDGGTGRINYVGSDDIIDTNYHLLTLVATGSEYLIYLDSNLVTGITKLNDTAAYRGLWTGSTELSSIDSLTVGGLLRGSMIGNTGTTLEEFVRVYDYAKNATQVADEFATIGGEK